MGHSLEFAHTHHSLHTPMKQGLDESRAQFMYISITSCQGNCTVHGCLTCTCLHHFCAQVDDDGNRSLPHLAIFLHQHPLQEIVKNRYHSLPHSLVTATVGCRRQNKQCGGNRCSLRLFSANARKTSMEVVLIPR